VTSDRDFLLAARGAYVEANASALRWMLGRPPLLGEFLNTKQNPLTLADYSGSDGWRGPGFLFGWIQGRGLEALATHAAYFAREDRALSAKLDDAGRALYGAVSRLHAADGHAYFCYDAALRPIYPDGDGRICAQRRPADLCTYSDAFVCKGLVAASARHASTALPRHLEQLAAVVASIEERRFVIDERRPLDRKALAAQAEDFAPRMILLGAAALLARIGCREQAAFGDRFIAHVLDRHYDRRTGLLRNVPGEPETNPGHAIEFVGFALDYLPADADPALVETLEHILLSSFRAGMADPGISLTVSVDTGAPASRYCPWWSLPETIRAAALAHERTGSRATLETWRRAHEAFFGRYWRGDPPIAYQTMTADGPIDHVPATPDLDPGYHTGLSLLAAIEVVDRLTADH
jgi:mannose/cellobiose epimerase-like protein (N-acyl-D-glucosamine 2-epimerase family)